MRVALDLNAIIGVNTKNKSNLTHFKLLRFFGVKNWLLYSTAQAFVGFSSITQVSLKVVFKSPD